MKEQLAYTRSVVLPRRAAELRSEIDSFHVEYCAVLDANDVERWPEWLPFCNAARCLHVWPAPRFSDKI